MIDHPLCLIENSIIRYENNIAVENCFELSIFIKFCYIVIIITIIFYFSNLTVKNCFLLIHRGNKFISSFASLVGTLYGPKYDGKYLRSLTNSLLGDLTLKETLTNVLIPAFDVKLLQPVLFSTQDVNEINFHLVTI